MNNPLLEIINISKSYVQAGEKLEILNNINFTLNSGEMVALVAPSGVGKSTFLHILGLLDHFDSGEIVILGEKISVLDEDRAAQIRLKSYGFVYQAHHLLPEFTALENVMMPLLIAGVNKTQAKEKAMEALALFYLDKRATHKPSQLSGGEQQRVAILRAIVHSPLILLADEPTGNLDIQTAALVFDELKNLVKKLGISALIATHSLELAEKMDRIITFDKGSLKFIKK